jgi:biotin-(acetyl-CoA carboxylase) ligase
LRLAGTPESRKPKSRRRTKTLHTFYEMADGSYLAFFEAPDMPFEQEIQHDYDLHIALEVDAATEEQMLGKGKTVGIETRGAGVVQAAGERRRAVSRAECELR